MKTLEKFIKYNERKLSLFYIRIKKSYLVSAIISIRPKIATSNVGKTYLACAIANSACRGNYPAMYKRAPRLYQEIAIARADDSNPKADE